jgi:hypothetical protein
MGYLKHVSKAYDKELAIKKKLANIDQDKKGKSFEEIEKLYRLDEMYEMEKAEVANGWKFSQIRLGKVVK